MSSIQQLEAVPMQARPVSRPIKETGKHTKKSVRGVTLKHRTHEVDRRSPVENMWDLCTNPEGDSAGEKGPREKKGKGERYYQYKKGRL